MGRFLPLLPVANARGSRLSLGVPSEENALHNARCYATSVQSVTVVALEASPQKDPPGQHRTGSIIESKVCSQVTSKTRAAIPIPVRIPQPNMSRIPVV